MATPPPLPAELTRNTSANVPTTPPPATTSNSKPKYYEIAEWTASDDRIVLWNRNNNRSFAISQADFLQRTNSENNLIPVDSVEYSPNAGERLLIKAENSVKLILPANPLVNDRISIVGATNFAEFPLQLDTVGQPFEGTPGNSFTGVELIEPYQSCDLVFAGDTTGWVSAPRVNWSKFGKLPEGYRFLLEGSLVDKSSLANPINKAGLTLPVVGTRLNNKPVLIFNGTDQKLSVPPFMQGATGATVYIVYSLDSYQQQYSLLRTNNGFDEFTRNGNSWSYHSLFLDRRLDNYHTEAPTSGTNLISFHISTNRFQLVQNGKNYGIRSGANFNPGNCFEIANLPFKGAISSLLVYPFEILPNSDQHQTIVNYFYKRYPALPWTAFVP